MPTKFDTLCEAINALASEHGIDDTLAALIEHVATQSQKEKENGSPWYIAAELARIAEILDNAQHEIQDPED